MLDDIINICLFFLCIFVKDIRNIYFISLHIILYVLYYTIHYILMIYNMIYINLTCKKIYIFLYTNIFLYISK